MVSWIFSRVIELLFGTLYPAYASYKAVKTKNIREYDIDAFLVRTWERSYETMLHFGKRGLNLAATASIQAATKGQGALARRLRSFSMQDLRSLPEQEPARFQDPLYLEEQESLQQPLGRRYESDSDEEMWLDSQVFPQRRKSLSRSQSLRSQRKNPGKEVKPPLLLLGGLLPAQRVLMPVRMRMMMMMMRRRRMARKRMTGGKRGSGKGRSRAWLGVILVGMDGICVIPVGMDGICLTLVATDGACVTLVDGICVILVAMDRIFVTLVGMNGICVILVAMDGISVTLVAMDEICVTLVAVNGTCVILLAVDGISV
ncbi:hypothetical protein TURU_028384 [Turdus rufiventris]|nr:hypothetical protein TURU_028384 [Turdus rufiventris]